jgi:hypothetical protein
LSLKQVNKFRAGLQILCRRYKLGPLLLAYAFFIPHRPSKCVFWSLLSICFEHGFFFFFFLLHSQWIELEFESTVLSTLKALFTVGAELDGKQIHKLRLRSGCSSTFQATGLIGELSNRWCWNKSVISGVVGFWNAGISWSGAGRETRVLLS